MNLEHLKTFICVVEKKSFSETARALHLAQPTVTAQIKALESHLNVTLFERNTKKVEPTPIALVLYRYAKEIIKLCEEAENEMLNMAQTVTGHLVISCSLTIGENILAPILRQFTHRYPHIHLQAEITNTSQILAKIHDYQLDIGLIEAEVEDPDLILEPFMEDELVVIASPTYFEAKKTSLTLEELKGLPLILREKGSGTRSVMEQHLIKAGLNPLDLNIYLELGSTEAVKSAVEEGLGISIISKTSINKEIQLESLKVYRVENITFSRHFYTVYHRDTVLKPQVEAFLNCIKIFQQLQEASSE